MLNNKEIHSDYFQIEEETIIKRKTPIYHIISKHSNTEIGQVKWYGAWRKFCFFPEKGTIWDNKCIKDLLDFICNVNEKKKEVK